MSRSVLRVAIACSVGVTVAAAITVTPAAASGSNYYVNPSGTDAGNDCFSSSVPCQTISHALAVEGLVGSGGTIHVAKGTYTEQVNIGPLNSSVTIVGANAKKTIIQPPASGLSSASDPNSASPVHAVIEVSSGTSGIKIEKLSVNGANGVGSLDTDGQGCAQSYVGIYFDTSWGTVSGVNISGMDVPSDQFGSCSSGKGVYVASDGSASSYLTMTSDVLPTTACTAKISLPLPGGVMYSNYIESVTKFKKSKGCGSWHGGPVLVAGELMNAVPFGPRAIQFSTISGPLPYEARAGSTVVLNPLASAYDKAGIVCENATTSCTITNSTVQGVGPNNQVSQDGIEILGASATIESTKVSANAFTGGNPASAAAGIRLINGGTFNVTGNTVTGNDVNIDGTWNPSLGPTVPLTYPPLSAGRVVPSPDGILTTGQSTLTSATANFQLSDVGRSVGSSLIFSDGATNIASSFSDGVTNGTNTFTSSTADFTAADLGQPIVETDLQNEIPSGTVILTVSDSHTVVLSHTAPTPATNVAFNLPSRPATLTSATANFTSADAGLPIVETDAGTTIQSNTTITRVLSATAVLLSHPATASTTGIAFDLPARSTGLSPGTYIAGYVSPAVALLSQPANATLSGLVITLGSLPGTWTINGNTASSATAVGLSTGETGYGEGIKLDSTDSCVDPPHQNSTVIVQGNTAQNNAQAGIDLTGAGCAIIGGAVSGQGNTSSGNQFGLVLDGPGSDCSPCSGPTSLAYESVDNSVVGNSFSNNNFGVLAQGITRSQSYGGPPPSLSPGTSGNVFSANTWTSNSVANVADFTGWNGGFFNTAFTLGSTPAAANYTSVISTTPVTLPQGRIIEITQPGLPTLVVIVSGPVTAATTIPVTPFTATGDYTGASAAVNAFADTAPANSWGSPSHDSCDPSGGGSASFDGATFNAGYFSC